MSAKSIEMIIAGMERTNQKTESELRASVNRRTGELRYANEFKLIDGAKKLSPPALRAFLKLYDWQFAMTDGAVLVDANEGLARKLYPELMAEAEDAGITLRF